MKRILTIIAICISPSVLAGGGNETQGARSGALGGASVTLSDVWSTTNNPAALGLMDRFAVGLAYETRYFLPEAGLKSVSFVSPLGGGCIGLIGHQYGYAGYRDNRVGLSYARLLNEYVSLGVQINYVQSRIGDAYGTRSTLVGEVGMLFIPSNKIRLGVHTYNPTRSKLADYNDERIPTALRIGGQYDFSAKVSAVAELDKDIDLPLNLKTGIEYQPAEAIKLRMGFATLQRTVGFGFGYAWKGLSADVAANWDQSLGYSSTISLVFEFGKRSS